MTSDSTTSDKVAITTYMNLLTLMFNGLCIDSFSDMKKIFSITERLSADTAKLIMVCYADEFNEVRIAMFRMSLDEKKRWTKGAHMTFAATSIEIASQMCKAPEVLFSTKPQE